MSLSLRSGLDPFFVRNWRAWKPFENNVGLEVDMKETDNQFKIRADCPGLNKEDIKVEVVGNNVLRIQGEKREEKERRDEWSHVKERKYGRFERSMPMPENANLDDVRAKYENGVLTIDINKRAITSGSTQGTQTGTQESREPNKTAPNQ